MNISDNDSYSPGIYDYEFGCDHSPDFTSRSMVLPVLYYVLFCVGLLGMFNKTSLIKSKNISLYTLLMHVAETDGCNS